MQFLTNCQNCGAPLSTTSLEAFAPICDRCGTAFVGVGGVLGLTQAQPAADPAMRRAMLQQQLEVVEDYIRRYDGAKHAYQQQLTWSPERYAKLPDEPELLEIETISTASETIGLALAQACGFTIPTALILLVATCIGAPIYKSIRWGSGDMGYHHEDIIPTPTGPFALRGWPIFDELFWLLVIAFCLSSIIALVLEFAQRAKAQKRNGDRPAENRRRIRRHEEQKAAAMNTAAAEKLAEDHRLRHTIAELEAKIRSAKTTGSEIRRHLSAKFG